MSDVENLNCGDVPRRKKSSPVGWFPRVKKESYLERKIRLIQEEQGTQASLDETLGASSRHLSRIEKEKRSAVTAAQEATETRKAALVEASWCRILKAARIPYMSAAMELQKAEKKAADAFNKAAALGVVLRTNNQNIVEANSGTPSSKYKVTASLDTAFEVDEEVAAALKSALEQIERTLERRSDPESDDSSRDNENGCDNSREAEENGNKNDSVDSAEADESKKEAAIVAGVESSSSSSNPLACLMLDRVRSLLPEQRGSLASMVATRGLNALLKEESYEQELNARGGKAGLGDVLVKHVSRLEAEKAAAAAAMAMAMAAKSSAAPPPQQQVGDQTREPLQEMMNENESGNEPVRKLSRLEMEKQQSAAAAAPGPTSSNLQRRKQREQETATMWGGLDLGSSLKRHVSKLEAEQAAWRRAAEDARNK